jgi:OPA family sugar phosphate sensor protein UhpC-like MFS transporter
MLRALLDWFKTGPDRPLASDDPAEIRRLYEKKRWSVFLALTIGYGMFYVVRLNFSVVKKPLLDEHVFSATQMGLIGSSLLAVYAIGRFANGFLCDRANIRRFMATALLLSALTNLVLGGVTSFVLFAALWGLNGWFQSIGAAPSGASLRQWFSPRTYGTRYGIWSSSHGLGTAITFVATSALVAAFGWRWGFWGPGLIALASALVLYRTLQDRPQTYGLPAVDVYEGEAHAAGSHLPVSQQQAMVLKDWAIWRIGLASLAMYVARYGINSWGVLYLQEAKGYSLVAAGTWLGIYTSATVVGAVASGWLSDRFFGARRNVPTLVFGVVEVVSLVALYAIPPGTPWLDAAALAAFGFALGALLSYLGGLWAVDIAPPQAAGAAMGLIGLLSYIGASLQDTISGMLLDASKTVVDGVTHYAFLPAFTFWVAASLVSIALVLSVWNARPRT